MTIERKSTYSTLVAIKAEVEKNIGEGIEPVLSPYNAALLAVFEQNPAYTPLRIDTLLNFHKPVESEEDNTDTDMGYADHLLNEYHKLNTVLTSWEVLPEHQQIIVNRAIVINISGSNADMVFDYLQAMTPDNVFKLVDGYVFTSNEKPQTLVNDAVVDVLNLWEPHYYTLCANKATRIKLDVLDKPFANNDDAELADKLFDFIIALNPLHVRWIAAHSTRKNPSVDTKVLEEIKYFLDTFFKSGGAVETLSTPYQHNIIYPDVCLSITSENVYSYLGSISLVHLVHLVNLLIKERDSRTYLPPEQIKSLLTKFDHVTLENMKDRQWKLQSSHVVVTEESTITIHSTKTDTSSVMFNDTNACESLGKFIVNINPNNLQSMIKEASFL